MAFLKCKMCGGDLNFEEGVTVVACEYCGTKQTVPNIDDEKKITLFGRANRLRYACEFDKASGIYESIVADFPEEAEAYWGLVLCKYGIEYVDDPATGKKVPTCHRSSFESVMEDDNFEQVLENADPIARSVYRGEAKQIEELRRGIIEVSGREEPYDIFICYKETDENGERTIDSVIAQDVYQELTAKGYRVFFSRITLEDKLGQEYEPYIFAALNSAKIMLAFGTDYEYYNAVWVKNEWSRFLQLIAKGEKKTLIPCYKNIDAYDMPKEFAKLQAQDMGKVGAVQDLLRGIEKLLPKNETASVKETVVVQQTAQSATTASLLERAFMYLEDSDWGNAADYCNRVLDISPKEADAYVGLLLAELRLRKEQELANQTERFDENKHFIKALRFSAEERQSVLESYKKAVEDYLVEQQRIEDEKKRREEEEKQRQEEEKRRQLAERRQALNATGLIFATRDFIFAVKWDNDSGVATRYSKGAYPWENIDIVAIATGVRYTLGLTLGGTVVATGDNDYGQCNVSNWRDIVAIATGDNHAVGLKSDSTVVAVGNNNYGQCNVSNWRDIIAIAAGYEHTVGLTLDGRVVATGNNKDEQCNVSNWRDIVAIATGDRCTVGLTLDGRVVAVGNNNYGQCNVSNWRDIVAIAVGYRITAGLTLDGRVVAVGNNYEQCNVSNWRDIVAIATGDNHIIGLESNGTVVAAGNNNYGQCNVSNWRDIVAIAADVRYTAGLKSNGTILTIDQKHYENKYEDMVENMVRSPRRQSNLCQYCGGDFKGLLQKKCSVCGKPKDY